MNLTSHSFDTGAAWAHLALQASLKGWHTHAIGGYDQAQVRQRLHIPEDYQLEAIIVIGQQGSKDHLPQGLQARAQLTDNNRRHDDQLIVLWPKENFYLTNR